MHLGVAFSCISNVEVLSLFSITSVMEKMHGPVYCTYNPRRVELIRLYKLLRQKNVDFPSKVAAQLVKLGFMKTPQVMYLSYSNYLNSLEEEIMSERKF